MKATVMDSYALIIFLERQEGYSEVARLLEECGKKDRELFLCIINWGEIIYHALRKKGEAAAKLTEDGIHALPIQLVEANKELTWQAARLKAFNKMSYADCFAAALAIRKKCELVTGDPEFKQVASEVKIHWLNGN